MEVHRIFGIVFKAGIAVTLLTFLAGVLAVVGLTGYLLFFAEPEATAVLPWLYIVIPAYLWEPAKWGGVLVLVGVFGKLASGPAASDGARPASDTRRPVSDNARRIGWVSIGIAATIALMVAAAHLYVRSGYRQMLAHCAAPPAVSVHRRIDQPVTSVLYFPDKPAVRPLVPLYRRPSEFATASGLEFVEQCRGDQCWRLTSRWPESPRVDQQSIEQPVSAIELRHVATTLEGTFLGARLLKLRYEVRQRATGETLAHAFEWVFYWGRWNRTGRWLNVQSRWDACGYAQSAVHSFDSGAAGDPIAHGYIAADMRLLLSVIPQELRPAKAIDDAAMLSPGAPPKALDEPRPVPSTPPIQRTLPRLIESGQLQVGASAEPSTGSDAMSASAPAAPAEAVPTEDFRGSVHLLSELEPHAGQDRGLSFSYCCAGAFSSAVAARSAPAGRSYLEALFVASSEQQSAGRFTGIGVGVRPGTGEAVRRVTQSVRSGGLALKSGDLVGVLIDSDLRKVTYSVNGKTVATADLTEFLPAERVLWVAVSAPQTKDRSSDGWHMNFGAEQFRFLPQGPVLAYDGSRPR